MTLDLRLSISGRRFTGWKRANIIRTMENLSGFFALSFTDSWEIFDNNWFIKPGDEAVVSVGGSVLQTGYVDSINSTIDGNRRTIRAFGRDRTQDLIDCSIFPPWEYANIKFETLAQKLVSPFSGIDVINRAGDTGEIIKDPEIQPGDSPYSVLERIARQRGLLLTTDGLGNMVIESISSQSISSSLVFGENVESATVLYDNSFRYSVYRAYGQQSSSDSIFGISSTEPLGNATDAAIKRFRPYVILAEAESDSGIAKKRAQWEAINRAADAATIEVEVPSWTQGNSDGSKSIDNLWPVNRLVYCKIPQLAVDGRFLITTVRFSYSEQGEMAALSLKRPDAFKPEPIVKEEDDFLGRLLQ